MGCAPSAAVDPAVTKTSQAIDKALKAKKRANRNTLRLLLLGAGGSGKTTFMKCLSFLYVSELAALSKQRLMIFTKAIRSNVLDAMRELIKSVDELYKGDWEDEELKALAASFTDPETSDVTRWQTETTPRDLQKLWSSKPISEMWERRAELQVLENLPHFMNKVAEIGDKEYQPSMRDALYCRTRTTGVREEALIVEDTNYVITDVGGQRAERRKWISCFDGVTAMIFFAAINEYDLLLYEDQAVNRLSETFHLFSDVCRSPWLASAGFLLFLNKIDLFKEKIQRVPLSSYFPDYDHGADEAAALARVKKEFKRAARKVDAERELYIHPTVSTDPENIAFVFSAVDQICRERAMGGAI